MDSHQPLEWVGVSRLTVQRGNGNSLRVWFTTTDGREISLAHCPVSQNGELVVQLDNSNIQVRT